MAKIKIKNLREFVENNIVKLERGRTGEIRVDVSSVFKKSPKGEKLILGAYYNYLGGGVCGRVVGASMFDAGYLNVKDYELFEQLKETAKQVLYSYDDEYLNVSGYEYNQGLPVSAY